MKKFLGQHFLRCPWVLTALLKAGEVRVSDTILEVGPGTGVLTRALARRARRIIAVEKDQNLAANLLESLRKENITNVEIVTADILRFLPHLTASYHLQTTNYKLISTIPYYLTSRLLRQLMSLRPLPERIVLTVQREVGERVMSQPPRMNLLALSVQAYATARLGPVVPKRCFRPQPKVESVILTLADISDKRFRASGIAEESFFALLRRAFQQRRKTLGASLRPLAKSRAAIQRELKHCDLTATARPQELTLDQWFCLYNRFLTE